eukprot:5929360-Alexandrium_andersonii.AAC.1
MSASLVGSEMCIRDRLSGRGAQNSVSQPRVPARLCTACPRELAPLSPVSYTHLTLPTICSV